MDACTVIFPHVHLNGQVFRFPDGVAFYELERVLGCQIPACPGPQGLAKGHLEGSGGGGTPLGGPLSAYTKEERRDFIRTFSTGATRDSDEGKPDYDGFLSPLVLEAYGRHMNKHRKQPDGHYRPADNWQHGIPLDAYMASGWRHFFDWWANHRGYSARENIVTSLCATIFNAMGYLHEYLKAHPEAMDLAGKIEKKWSPVE